MVYLHGAIGSPQSACPQLEAIVEELGLRYVLVSRPGFGDSDPAPGRTLASFAGDVAQLADAFERPRFAVVGVSAGGPYALACACALPERVQLATVVSCMTPGPVPVAPACRRPRASGCACCASIRAGARAPATRCSRSHGATRGSSPA